MKDERFFVVLPKILVVLFSGLQKGRRNSSDVRKPCRPHQATTGSIIMLDCHALEMVPSGSIFYRLRNSPGKYSARKLPLELTQGDVDLIAGEQGAKTSTVLAGRRMSRSEHE
jgi:hypothetical protein